MHQDESEREPQTWGLSLQQFFALTEYVIAIMGPNTQPDRYQDVIGTTINVTDAGVAESLANAGLDVCRVEEITIHEEDYIVVMLEGAIHVFSVVDDYLHRFEPTYELEDEDDTD